MEMNFCRRCGAELINVKNHAYKCANGHAIYANASPCSGIYLIDGDEILLSVRGVEPNVGKLDSFGGFVDGAESFENAAVRELQEELGLNPGDYGDLMFLRSGAATDYTFANEQIPLVAASFVAKISAKNLTPRDDVADVFRSHIMDVPLDQIHLNDVRECVLELQKRWENHDAPFGN